MVLKQTEALPSRPLSPVDTDTLPTNRLPTTAEIKNHRGFPSVGEEDNLRRLFLQEYYDKAKVYAADELNWKNPTENQLQLFMYYLYGVYFVNLTVGGQLIDKNFNDRQLTKWILQDASAEDGVTMPDLDVGNLKHWPIERGFDLSFLNEKVAAADVVDKIVQIYVRAFSNTDPNKLHKSGAYREVFPGFRFSIAIEPTNEIPLGLRWITHGIEEAVHIYSSFVEEKNYGHKKNFGDSAPKGPMVDLNTEEAIRKKASIIAYYAELGDEFAAHVVRSQYLKEYFPDIYNHGYRKFDLAVRKARKEGIKKFRKKYKPENID